MNANEPTDPRVAFNALWETLDIGEADTLGFEATATFVLQRDRLKVRTPTELPALPSITGPALTDSALTDSPPGPATHHSEHPEIELKATLGEGGMGVVRLATQVPLGREVAVKTLRESDASDPQKALVLLREAWMTGLLEHPNIIPVYTLGTGPSGAPMLVMKRIEGRVWR